MRGDLYVKLVPGRKMRSAIAHRRAWLDREEYIRTLPAGTRERETEIWVRWWAATLRRCPLKLVRQLQHSYTGWRHLCEQLGVARVPGHASRRRIIELIEMQKDVSRAGPRRGTKPA